ncbi:MAG: hypothetical protein PHC34_04720 [Candidatus Gastranaerophilales bacterium]|nr:hypothetical protein [Candidatus Gastranaerophilales bacterium]
MIKVYTDAVCHRNGEPDSVGAWSFVIHDDKEDIECSGIEEGTTIQRVELIAVIQALKFINEDIKLKNIPIIVYSDSKYAINYLKYKTYKTWNEKKWKKIANMDLWIQAIELSESLKVDFIKTNKHCIDEWKNRANCLAKSAIEKYFKKQEETNETS